MTEFNLSDKRATNFREEILGKEDEHAFYLEKDVKEAFRRLKEEKKQMIKDFDYFCSKCNFAKSHLDSLSIVFMNNLFLGKYIDIDKIAGDKLVEKEQ
jgi:hypothetical protein